jgi:hypothetical protein
MLFGFDLPHQTISIMKKLSNFLKISVVFLFIASCTFNGSQGPQGQQGPAGADGSQFEAIAYEYQDITFSGANNYSVVLEFPEADWDLILPSDVVLMYQLVDYDAETDTDFWEPLPRTLFPEFGTLLYTYDFTEFDAKVFLDANFNLSLISNTNLTNNLIYRVVIVPAENTGRSTKSVDYANYNEVMDYYGLTDDNVRTIK